MTDCLQGSVAIFSSPLRFSSFSHSWKAQLSSPPTFLNCFVVSAQIGKTCLLSLKWSVISHGWLNRGISLPSLTSLQLTVNKHTHRNVHGYTQQSQPKLWRLKGLRPCSARPSPDICFQTIFSCPTWVLRKQNAVMEKPVMTSGPRAKNQARNNVCVLIK